MSGTMTLLHLAGYVALLIWGIHMVHTGIIRAFGAQLRKFLTTGLRNRGKAFLAGMGITAILQSSTATGLMTTSFIASGLMELVPALAVTLGANVGTTLIVQVLTFDIAAVAPILVLIGLITFKRGAKTRVRDLGRVAIGLGLLLLALHLIVGVIEPVEQGAALRQIFALLAGEPIIYVLIAALMTWAAYSSVAVVLLVMSLSGAHIVTPMAALALVLGANLGNVIPQYLAAGQNPAARRLALGNLIVRGCGCIVALPFLRQIAEFLAMLEGNPAREAADFHTLFNLVLGLIGLALLDPLARLCSRLVSAQTAVLDPGKPIYIEEAALAMPNVALSDAAREVLRIVDVVDAMLRAFLDALRTDDRKLLTQIAKMDDTLDRLHNAVKLYLTAISREEGLDEADAKRCSDILAFTINLEHCGDILDKSLREIAAKKIKNRLSFSAEGLAEITRMHGLLLGDLRLAVSVFMTGNAREARTLLDAKVRMRDMEREATENHLRRLREGRPESVETSALHLDIVRDLKRIAAHIASVAYPILDQSGVLARSRLLGDSTAEVETVAATTTPQPGAG